MELPAYRVKQNGDGSFDIWVTGQHIHFSKDGEPYVGNLEPAQDAVDSDPNVRLFASDGDIAVRCHGRVVLI
jgi:hypothetical protein